MLHRPVLFDVDDAIWLLSPGHERATRAVARRAACVVAGNDFLADWFATGGTGRRAGVDGNRHRAVHPRAGTTHRSWWDGPARDRASGTCGRSPRPSGGSSREVPDARLVVVADAFIDLPGVPVDRIDLVPWSPETEATAIQGFDVGLMPLTGGDWAKGKCAFKMLQYMACGVPAVVSPVGMNTEVLAMADVGLAASIEDEWVEALLSAVPRPGRGAGPGPQRQGAGRALLLATGDRRGSSPRRCAATGEPTGTPRPVSPVHVLVVAYGDPDTLGACLEALGGDLPRDRGRQLVVRRDP